MPTIKYTREDITKLENERDQYKTAHNKLTAGLKEAVGESIKYKRERDSLLQDIELLRKNQKTREEVIENFRDENDSLKALSTEMSLDSARYWSLTEHIRDKAKNNPGNSRYIALVHFIDDLEAD